MADNEITGLPPAPAAEPAALETEVFEIRPSAWAFWGEMLFGILLSVVGVGLLLLAHVWVRTHSLRYRLTTQRLFVVRGLLSRQTDEVELFRIKDATVRQSMMERLFGVGTITLLSGDESTPQFTLVGVARPAEVKDTIRLQYRASRVREGVRAAEFMPS
jgi:membrane protein YdbS with pleckstrin-like domain